MAWMSAQWPAVCEPEMLIPAPANASDEPPRKRTKVDQACDQCRRRKRKCSAARPCFQCVEDKVTCSFEPQNDIKRTDRGSAHVEILTRQVQRCVEALQSHNEKLHHLSMKLQHFEDGEDVTRGSSWSVARGPPCLHAEMEYCANPIKHSDYWPVVSPILAQIGFRLKNRQIQRFEPPESPWASAAEGKTTFDSKEPPIYPISFTKPSLECSSPVEQNLQPETVHLSDLLRDALLRSYVRNMHVLHPIVDLKYLQTVWDRSLGRKAKPGERDPGAKRVYSPHNGSKRKRERRHSLGDYDSDMTEPSKDVQYCLETALAHIVLALGAVCSEKEASQVPEKAALFEAQMHADSRNRMPSGSECSPLDTQLATFPWRAMKAEGKPNRASSPATAVPSANPGGAHTQHDFLCGLGRQYRASAEKILRSVNKGGADLIRAQIFILFGLFEGQMGNAEKSMDWIRAAGQIAMKLLVSSNLLHPYESEVCEDIHENYRRVQRLVQIPQHDFIVLVAWSCIQLEGDILSGHPVIASGIRSLESRIPWPYRIPNSDMYGRFLTKSNQTGGAATGHDILVFYTSQLWIRKWVNTACAELYNEARTNRTDEQICDVLREQQSTLDCWRACLPEEIRWEDSDLSACDILSARLRATYWSAQYAISQVYLDHLLYVDSRGGYGEDAPLWHSGLDLHAGRKPNLRLLRAIRTTTTSEITQGTERCVRAMIESVIAFDRMPHKLIATNIYGAAQTQLSTALILFAASAKNPKLIPSERLRSVLKRTIAFLGQHASEVSHYTTDLIVLQRLLAALH